MQAFAVRIAKGLLRGEKRDSPFLYAKSNSRISKESGCCKI